LILVTHNKESAAFADRKFELIGGCLYEVDSA
jgi:ABC-type lipoprotein export system ATPase subunit